MSVAREIIGYNRPRYAPGRGDKYLAEAAQELAQRMRKIARQFSTKRCQLPERAWTGLASLVIEWAEDIHNDLGLWRTVELHQQSCLGTPLPLIVAPNEGPSPTGFDPRRLRFLLWNLWPYFDPETVLSPAEPDLARLAETGSEYLNARFARLPKDSGIAHFLAQPNPFGWEVKKKLAWLGCNSYLFRLSFFWSTSGGGKEADVLRMDEFLSRHFGRWSGLGPIDVLASILTLNAAEREELLNWRERHMSMFRVLDMDQSRSWVHTVSARNLVNGQDYTIRIEQGLEEFPFLPPRVVFGWLVPWHGEWCWSGEQRLQGEVPEAEDAKLRAETIRALGHFVYRYCPAEMEKACYVARQMHEEFIQLYGSDVKVFPDGRTAQDTERKRLERWQHAHTELFGLPPGDARPLSLPPPLLESTQGVAAFSSPTTGVEYAREFKLLESGLAKKGQGLTEDEAKAIRGFIMAAEISPAFVHRTLAESGPASIFEAFAIRDYPPDTALNFLLRRHKGEWFDKTYPHLPG